MLEKVPEWLGAALIGAAIAFIGFVGKTITESVSAARAVKQTRRAELVTLHSLLQASRSIFEMQIQQRDRLLSMIGENHPEMAGRSTEAEGYDAIFTSAFSKLTPEERELHGIIRGMTMHAMRPTNNAILEWIRKDTHHKGQQSSSGLPNLLSQLETHLLLWHAKYEAWIPEQPAHALVYLADEKNHGVGFPSGIDSVVAKAIGFSN